MTERELAAKVAGSIGRLGGAFMIGRESKAFAGEIGLSGLAPYLRGRCSVLGDVDADVVTAAVGFFPADAVREAWEAGKDLPPEEMAQRYAQVAWEFGRRKLADLGESEAWRLAGLLQRVADTGDVVGAPLFAGWRARPLPEDVRARVVHLAHVVRELRGALHLVAVLASGLSPLEAVLSRTSSSLMPPGELNAEIYGWPRPYPEVSDEIRSRRAQAEDLTDVLVAPAFAELDRSEGAELAALLARAETIAFS